MNENKGGEKTGEGKGELIPEGGISLSPETTKISSEIEEKDKNKEEKIKEQLEKKLEDFLALGEEDRIQDVLEEVIGNKLEKEDLEKVMVFLRGKEGGLISRIASKLIEKYGEEPLSRILRAVSGFDEMVNDSMELIESEVAKEVKNCYNELQRKGELKMNLREVSFSSQENPEGSGKVIFLTEKMKGRKEEKMKVDKSRETPEQKEMKEKIREAIQEAVEENIARIESLLKKEKSKGVTELDEEKVKSETEKVKGIILKNLDGHADLMFQFLKDNQESPYIDQLMRLEARRVVANVFGENQEIGKILPKTDFSKIRPRRFSGKEAKDKEKKKKTIVSEPSESPEAENFSGMIEESRASIEEEKKDLSLADQKDSIDLSEEEILVYKELREKAGVEEISSRLTREYKKRGFSRRKIKIQVMRDLSRLVNSLKEIAKQKEFDLDYFEKYFLDVGIWEDYFEEMEKRKREGKMSDEKGDLESYNKEFLTEIRDYAIGRAGYNEKETRLIEKYFESRLLLENFLKTKFPSQQD